MATPNDQPSDSITEQANRWVVRLNSGELSTGERAELAAWRAADPRHDTAFRDAEAAWAATSNLSQDKKTGLVRAGKARKRRKPTSSVILLGGGLALAAAGWFIAQPRHDYSSATAELREVVLPDGSRATLNARAALDIDFTGGRRHVTLARGEAFFEVRHDPAQPFEVSARDARVTVRGTAFNIKHRTDVAVEIAVTEHSVDVSSTTPGTAHVTERHKVTVAGGRVSEIKPANPDVVLSWRQGELIAEDAPLADVISELSDYYSGWIVLSDSARTMRVNAVLGLRDTQRSLNALAAGLPIQVRRISPYLTIVTAR